LDVVLVILRLFHVVDGILWAGGAIFLTWFVEPVAMALGPKAGPFMGALNDRKIGVYFSIVASLAVLVGTILYWKDANGDVVGFFTGSAFGFALGVGGIAAWIAWIIGFTRVRVLTAQLGEAGAKLAAAEGPPAPELIARLQGVQHDLHQVGLLDFWLIAIAVVLMSTARYL